MNNSAPDSWAWWTLPCLYSVSTGMHVIAPDVGVRDLMAFDRRPQFTFAYIWVYQFCSTPTMTSHLFHHLLTLVLEVWGIDHKVWSLIFGLRYSWYQAMASPWHAQSSNKAHSLTFQVFQSLPMWMERTPTQRCSARGLWVSQHQMDAFNHGQPFSPTNYM